MLVKITTDLNSFSGVETVTVFDEQRSVLFQLQTSAEHTLDVTPLLEQLGATTIVQIERGADRVFYSIEAYAYWAYDRS